MRVIAIQKKKTVSGKMKSSLSKNTLMKVHSTRKGKIKAKR